MHIKRDPHVGDTVVHEFRASQISRDHSDHVSAISQNGVRKDSHHAGTASAINQRVARLSEADSQQFSGIRKFRQISRP